MSYGGQLHFGVLGDRDLVPDVDKIARYLEDELRTLHDACCAATSPAATTSVTAT
jgi:hypothetical protein